MRRKAGKEATYGLLLNHAQVLLHLELLEQGRVHHHAGLQRARETSVSEPSKPSKSMSLSGSRTENQAHTTPGRDGQHTWRPSCWSWLS